MKSASWLAIVILASASACGGDDGLPVAFRRHALLCEPEGKIEAKMQISDVGFCDLEVADDRTVSGVCPNVPTGAVRIFRLIYFVVIEGREVQLATVLQTLDLTGETRRTITLEFSSDAVETNYDDDADGQSNIVELCTGRSPIVPGV
ncbi:hypothetical protein L6R52_13155 [Myxococcota bacterium]|nr:hypothetical protein [Myxococcota bacterium]